MSKSTLAQEWKDSKLLKTIIKQVSWNKFSLLLKIFFLKHTNITTKLKWKIFIKAI
jgi:hypothetical protein